LENYVLRWGILGCGKISKRFTEDLLIDPHSRGVKDISHQIAAIGSRSLSKAQDFATKLNLPASVHCYGTYEELLSDPSVHIIYVSTPHTIHYENVIASLKAGKHVLCEKPFMINAEEIQKCAQFAKDKNLFLMEAVWTRFFPATKKFRELIACEKIGKVNFVKAELGFDFKIEKIESSHRILDPALGGGVLLDLGVYPLTWAFLALFTQNSHESPQVNTTMINSTVTKVDRFSAAVLNFKRAESVAFISTDMDKDYVNIVEVFGSKGLIRVSPLIRPVGIEVIVEGEAPQKFEFPITGEGFYLQADEAARCIRDGKKECETMSWNESVEVMKVMDEMRKQGGLIYPSEKK